jgi:uncharacterized protein (TIRG00374 family)
LLLYGETFGIIFLSIYSGGPMKKKRSLFSIIYISLTIIVIAAILIFGTNLKDIGDALQNFRIWWLIACIGALLLYWLTDGLLLHDITAYMYKREPLYQSIKISIIGLYYGALTPSSTGGQPMQVVYMRRNKVPVGTATCIVCIKFVVYELSLCTIYVIGMLLRGAEYYKYNAESFWFATFGFVINLVAVFFIILTIVNKKLVLKVGSWLIRLCSRIRIVKNKEQTLENFEKTIDDYHTAASYISRYKLRALGSYLISMVNLAFLFVIPYLIYLSFGLTQYTVFDMFIMESFLFLAVSFFPLPGAAGASEAGFVLFFGPFFSTVTLVGMLIWRFLTYYLILIVGSLIVVLDEVFSIKKLKKRAGLNGAEK